MGEANAQKPLDYLVGKPTWFPCRACFIEEAAISRPWYGKRVEMHRVSREVSSA